MNRTQADAHGGAMRYIILVLFAASLLTVIMVVAAENSDEQSFTEYEQGLEELLTLRPHLYAGLVFKTNRGTAITTNRGTFLLKGPGVGKMVGRDVEVRGVLREGAILAMAITENL